MDVKRAAELAEMPIEEFQFLNPHYNRPVIAGADEYTLLLPIDKAELFAAKLDLTDQPLVSWQAYRMRNGETLPQVAAKFGMPVESLRAVNGLGTKAKVPAGHTLLVPSTKASSEAELGLANAVFTTVPQGRTFYYRVNRGDTLAHIASRYDVSVQDIKRWNGLAQPTVVPGQSLRITSDRAPNVAAAKRATGRKATASAVKPVPKHTTATPAAKKPATAAPARTGTRSAKTGTAAGT
jgi:membrane-bound lytic murein transglycosylase D